MAKKAKPKTKSKRKPKPRPQKKRGASVLAGNMPNAKDLAYLARLSDECKGRASTASGEIGQAIRDFSERKSLNSVAFRKINALRQIGVKDPLKLRIVLDHFDVYRDLLKLDDLAAPDIIAPARPKSSRKRPTRATASKSSAKVVPLATAMSDAIAADKKGQMEAA